VHSSLRSFRVTAAAQRSPLFHPAVSRGSHVLVHFIAVNIRFSLTTFNEGAGIIFLRFAGTRFVRD
jgi:hypothetical protein